MVYGSSSCIGYRDVPKEVSIIEKGPTGPMATAPKVGSTTSKAEFSPPIEDTSFEDVSTKDK